MTQMFVLTSKNVFYQCRGKVKTLINLYHFITFVFKRMFS
jgi:hypothetical protein